MYTGPSTITVDGTVIDAMVVVGNLHVMADDVRITRSIVHGRITIREPGDGSLVISDSEIHNPDFAGTGLGRHNFVATRVEVTGGKRSIYCKSNCTIEDSWVHGQGYDPEGRAHMSGIRMSQDTTLRHNTITCDGGRIPPGAGCSAGLTGYGDIAPVRDNLIEGNLFLGGTSTMCAYGGSSDSKPYSSDAANIRFIDNVFVRGYSGTCGARAAIASFDPEAPGNLWVNNRWDDGTFVVP